MKLKMIFEETNISPIVDILRKWEHLIERDTAIKSIKYSSGVLHLLQLCGFIDIKRNGENFDGTLDGSRFINIQLLNRQLEPPKLDNISGDMIQTIHFNYSTKEK